MRLRGVEMNSQHTTMLLIPDARENRLPLQIPGLYSREPASAGLGKGPGICRVNKLPQRILM